MSNISVKKHIGKDGIRLNNFGITQIVKHFHEIFDYELIFDFGNPIGSIDINESIQETHSIVTSSCNKKS